MKHSFVILALVLFITGVVAPDGGGSPGSSIHDDPLFMYIAESCEDLHKDLIRGINSALARATLVVDKMGFMFEANPKMDEKRLKIHALAKKLFGDDDHDTATAEQRIRYASQLKLASPDGLPLVKDTWIGKPGEIVIYCDYTVRFKLSEKDPNIYTDGVHKWSKKDFDAEMSSKRTLAFVSTPELDDEGYPIGPNSLDITPVYKKVTLEKKKKFFDTKNQAQVTQFLSSLEEGSTHYHKPWIDLTLHFLDSVLFHEFTHTDLCMIDGLTTIDIESTEWPGDGGAYGWFNAVSLRNHLIADNVNVFAMAVYIESLGFTINLNTGKFFPDLKDGETDKNLIDRVRKGLSEEMPKKPDGWRLIPWSKGGPWVPPAPPAARL